MHPCWSTAVISRSNNHIPHHSDDCAIRWLQHIDYQMDNLRAKATKHREWVEHGNCTFTRFSQSTPYFNAAPDGRILENCQQTCATTPGLNVIAPSRKRRASVTNSPHQQNLQVALPMRDLHISMLLGWIIRTCRPHAGNQSGLAQPFTVLYHRASCIKSCFHLNASSSTCLRVL